MIRRLLLLLCLTLGFPVIAQDEINVTVQVAGIGESSGDIVVFVFDNKKDWLKKPLTVEKVTLGETSSIPVELQISLPAGAYAFQVYHDLDSNGKMKTSFIGIPKEPSGVSNGAKGRFGPPKFKDAVVDIDDTSRIVAINLVEI